ncbi:MAG: DUF1015 family protein [Pseudomonadota bacterium]
MVELRAFKGIRPPAELASRVASPPYDVLSVSEARDMASPEPYSFLHVIRAEVDLDEDINPYSDEVYEKGGENFNKFMSEGILRQDDAGSLTIYRLEMDGRIQTGVVGAVSSADYEKGLIKKHELTRPDKEKDRTKHTLALGVNPGPVFLTYVATDALDALTGRLTSGGPDYDFVAADGIRHTLWVVRRPDDIKALEDGFAPVPCLYIADGHHRASVANIIAKKKKKENPDHKGDELYNYFLAVCFPHDQLKIMDYNRVVKDLAGLGADEFMGKVKEKFDLAPSDVGKPAARHTFKMLLHGTWYELTAKPGTFDEKDPVGGLDVSILQDNLLGPVLGIKDPRTDKRIDFVGGIRGMQELEARCSSDCAVAFALYPMSIEELLGIADAGLLVPPKSTWFEPKLRSGLVVKPL